MKYPTTLRDHKESDDDIRHECILNLAKGVIVVSAAMLVLWVFI